MLVSTSTLFDLSTLISSLNEEQTSYLKATLKSISNATDSTLISDNLILDTLTEYTINVSLKEVFEDVFVPWEFVINTKDKQVFSKDMNTEKETLITYDEIEPILSNA